MSNIKRNRESVVEIVRDAGGQIVGRTRLQKIAYLLELTGQGAGFDFEYRYYGPYSESLTEAVQTACLFDLITETEQVAKWGGHYSIYQLKAIEPEQSGSRRAQFVKAAAGLSAIELELAATAAYLKVVENHSDPWQETERRKPEKAANDRLANARRAYSQLSQMDVPRPLPELVH